MELKELHCKICGGTLQATESGVYQCETSASHKCKEEDLLEQRAQLLEAFGEDECAQKEERVAEVRRSLWKAVRDPGVSSEEIALLCGELKGLLPQDFLARFYETAACGTADELKALLDGLDAEKQAVYLPEVLAYISNRLLSVAYKEDAKHAGKPQSEVSLASESNADSEQADAPPPKKRRKAVEVEYVAPPLDLLEQNAPVKSVDTREAEEKARVLEKTLKDLKFPAIVEYITRGPAVTRYELKIPAGVPIKRIEQYSADIAYQLECNGKVRIEAPIPGKKSVGVEVPNDCPDLVRLREVIESDAFQDAASPLTVALGKDIEGNFIVCNLMKMPHLLIAGATGSGKSVCLNAIIVSLLYKASPDDVRLILIDPKRVEFNLYRGLPHLITEEIINETRHAMHAFTWMREEMDRRYKLFGKYCVRDLQGFNQCDAVKEGSEQKLPYIVAIVDELAELMLGSGRKELEDNIMSIAQKARAAGIHLILATQRPTVDVITGTIKANLPSRIAFAVKSMVDSRTVLDESGAETLLGRGDMLYAGHGVMETMRVQGAYVSDKEIATITAFVRKHNEEDFFFDLDAIDLQEQVAPPAIFDDDTEADPLLPEVLKAAIKLGSVSTSMIQRRFSVGYARASRILDQLEARKFIGPLNGGKPREVYISREQYEALFGEDPALDAPAPSEQNEEGRRPLPLNVFLFKQGLAFYEKAQYPEAIEHWRRAAEMGHADAQYCLGCFYHFGEKVEKDDEEAVKWFRMAAEQGHADAKKALKRMGIK